MPVIHTHVSVSTTPEQREALKAAYGKAVCVQLVVAGLVTMIFRV